MSYLRLHRVIPGVAFGVPEETGAQVRIRTGTHGNIARALRYAALTGRHRWSAAGRDAARLAASRVRASLRRDVVRIHTQQAMVAKRSHVGDAQCCGAVELLLHREVPLLNHATKLFSPRVGLAWDVFGNGKTAVRAGFGTYYSLIDDLSFLMNSLPPYNGSITSSGSLFSIVPIIPGSAVPPSCGPGIPAPCTTYAPQGVQADARTPTVQEWNFSVEQQLNSNTALRVAYV